MFRQAASAYFCDRDNVLTASRGEFMPCQTVSIEDLESYFVVSIWFHVVAVSGVPSYLYRRSLLYRLQLIAVRLPPAGTPRLSGRRQRSLAILLCGLLRPRAAV